MRTRTAGQGRDKRNSWSHSVPAFPKAPETRPQPSLQHLSPGLRQLQSQRATKGKGGRGKEDGCGLGDPHKGREDADPQHGGQLAQGVQEAKGRRPVGRWENGVGETKPECRNGAARMGGGVMGAGWDPDTSGHGRKETEAEGRD